jgi:hypothetical protein
MPHDDLDSFRFGFCRDLYGGVQQVSCGRRNGKPAIFFTPNISEASGPPTTAPEFREQERLFVNLTPIERETWRKILSAQSITSIAKEEGVSRAAIYARIEGNRKGQGGMIAKNVWCLLWWRLRQKLFTRESHV